MKERNSIINPGWIPGAVGRVLELLEGVDGTGFLVGGSVVDLLCDREPKDWDVECYGVSMDVLGGVLEEFNPSPCGKSFGIFKLDSRLTDGVDIDVSVPRRDNNVGKGHADFAIEPDPTMDPTEAARRRDFTINSIALNIRTGEVFDPFGGIADLEAGVLRATDPETFVEDPLRALRAVQLLARKATSVDPATLELIRGMVWEFPNIAKERVFEEISKLLLKAEKPSVGLEFLLDSGWLRWFPELNEMAAWSGWDLEENAKFHGTAPEFLTSGCPQNPDWHPEGDVWIHNGMVVDAAARVRHRIDEEWRLAFMLGALLHDIAKPITTELPVCTAHGHDSKGEELAETFLGRLTNERKLIDRVVSLVANHLRPFQLLNGEAKPAAWKRLHKRALNRLDVLGWMSRADWAGRPNRDPLHATENGKVVEHKASAQCWDWHEELGIDPVVPVLMGRHLIAAGFRPGPGFKVMLDAAFEAQLEDEGLGLEELLEVATAVG